MRQISVAIELVTVGVRPIRCTSVVAEEFQRMYKSIDGAGAETRRVFAVSAGVAKVSVGMVREIQSYRWKVQQVQHVCHEHSGTNRGCVSISHDYRGVHNQRVCGFVQVGHEQEARVSWLRRQSWWKKDRAWELEQQRQQGHWQLKFLRQGP